mmetsp:Transcript_14602/g.20432  ORF Transcript_14602/g.20432 Transcript_14602/m.20432 type:complete len:761 (+) Transcript_14602:93-2375(+)|eukprot:CAMPEP_0184482208 /NCGR_PEP_ID=MMETSP0113_2-20130426/3779_1 /TAXON_ID=91329 /ORGANISM="Norrisiella sphaerica, Strain BC52" /LENGTH=760 /DNA_ID=CAMNT_0026861813 /DNA_START=366 /DNA_END=2648 /DNA_ORIENTATION=-
MSGGALLTVIIPSAAIATVYLVAFECLRGRYTEFFAPKFRDSNKGEYPFPGVFGWITGVLRIPDEEVAEACGMDGVALLRFLWMGVETMGILSILGMVILAPIYSTGGKNLTGLLKIGLSNLEQQSELLWAPAVMVWVFTAVIFFIMWKNYSELEVLRKKCMYKGEPRHYTMLLTKIPQEYDTEGKIREYLEPLYPGQIKYIRVVKDLKEREKKTLELQKNSLSLLVAQAKAADAAEKGEDPPMVRTKFFGLCGEKVEAVPHFDSEVKRIKGEIEEKLTVESAEYCRAAFVTFNSVTTAIKATGTRITSGETWEVHAATRPSDIIWSNLTKLKPKVVQDGSKITVNLALAALVIFWAIPIAAGGALANLEQLAQDISFLEPVLSLPSVVIAIIEGFGPTIWRVVLMILLQPIIYSLILMTGVFEGSEKERGFTNTYYWFLLVNIYFVTLFASSIFSTIGDIVSDPISIFELLGESIPAVAIEMIQYMVLQGAGGVSPIARLVPLIIMIILTKLATVEYQKKQAMKKPLYQYGVTLAMAGLMWTISLAYMAISPLILPFGCIYFFTTYIVQKYLLMYVTEPEFETYGTFWPIISSISLGGLFLSQIATMALVGLKFGAYQQLIMFPLPVLTLIFKYEVEGLKGKEMSEGGLPLKNASEMDKTRSKKEVDAFLGKAHEMPLWAQECLLVDLDHPLEDPAEPPVLDTKDKAPDDETKMKEAQKEPTGSDRHSVDGRSSDPIMKQSLTLGERKQEGKSLKDDEK